jgi:enoyl-CoA hydratase/long-chain 3-hydroxyacyl-CoA dehydrogenase
MVQRQVDFTQLLISLIYKLSFKFFSVLGLPEVMLGLLPGAGGTQRLPKLISLPDSLDMMLTGKNIRPFKAKKMGLVDQTVTALGPGVSDPEQNTIRYLEDVAVDVAKGFANGVKIAPRNKPLMEKITSLLKPVVFNMASKGVQQKTLGNYPAPKKILEVVQNTLGGAASGYDVESKAFGELAMTNESKALISIYFANTSLKKNRFGEPKKRATNVGMLGAG